MRYEHVVGDVQLHPDRAVDGWCWAPSRPDARLRFDLLADDRIVASGEASLPRPDLSVHGMTDTQHGFRLTLSPDALDRDRAVLLSARERGSRVVFGRRLVPPAEPEAAAPEIIAVQQALGVLSERLAARGPTPLSRAARLRAACGTLATILPARTARNGADIAAARRLLAGAGSVALARPAAPRATLVLLADMEAPALLTRLRALAPATFAIDAEVLLVDPGVDARTTLLPSLVAGLHLLPAPAASLSERLTLIAGLARGDWLLLLSGDAGGAALPWLLARLDTDAIMLATAPRTGTEGLARLRLISPTGVALAVRRGAVAEADTPASLLARLMRDKAACVVLDESWPPPGR